jgi:hypothetical protein
MDYDWPNLAVMIDLNKGHAGVDLTSAKGHVDAVEIYLGRPVPGDPEHCYYDPECANNYERAIAAGIPAIGLMVELKPSFWVTDPWGVTLGYVESQDKSKNPLYMFVQNFFASTRIQDDMKKTPITFITLVVDEAIEGAVWNAADLFANIKHLNVGMAEGKIPKVKIFVAAIPEIVNSDQWIQAFGTKDASNLFEGHFYRDNVGEGVMVQSSQSKPGTYTWDTLANCLPNAGTRPVFKQGNSKAGQVAYLGAKPNPRWWAHTFGGVYLPNGKGGVVQFGISSSWDTKTGLYNFLGVKDTVPPVETKCEEGFHKDTNGNCVVDEALPTDHGCASDEVWNEQTQKCEKETIPPLALLHLQDSVDKLQDTSDEILTFLKDRFK